MSNKPYRHEDDEIIEKHLPDADLSDPELMSHLIEVAENQNQIIENQKSMALATQNLHNSDVPEVTTDPDEYEEYVEHKPDGSVRAGRIYRKKRG